MYKVPETHFHKLRANQGRAIDHIVFGLYKPYLMGGMAEVRKAITDFFHKEEDKPARTEISLLFDYYRCEEQTFSLGPEMQELLFRTDTPDIRLEDVKLPYDTFYVSLEGFGEWNEYGSPIIGAYVSNSAEENSFNIVGAIDTWGEYARESTPQADVAVMFITGVSAYLPSGLAGVPKVQARTYVPAENKHLSVEETIDFMRQEAPKTPLDLTDEEKDKINRFNAQLILPVDKRQKIVRIVTNMILYLQCQGRGIDRYDRENSPDAIRLQKQIKRRIRQDCFYTKFPRGRDTPTVTLVAPSIEEAAQESGDVRKPGGTWERGSMEKTEAGIQWRQPTYKQEGQK